LEKQDFEQEQEYEAAKKREEQSRHVTNETYKESTTYPTERASGRAIAALVLGIAAITIGCCFWLNILLGPAALIVGILENNAINKGESSIKGKGFAITGIVLGIIATLFGIFSLFLLTVGGSIFDSLTYYLKEYQY